MAPRRSAHPSTTLAVVGIVATIGAAYWLYQHQQGSSVASPAVVTDASGVGGSGGAYSLGDAGSQLIATVPAPANVASPGLSAGNPTPPGTYTGPLAPPTGGLSVGNPTPPGTFSGPLPPPSK